MGSKKLGRKACGGVQADHHREKIRPGRLISISVQEDYDTENACCQHRIIDLKRMNGLSRKFANGVVGKNDGPRHFRLATEAATGEETCDLLDNEHGGQYEGNGSEEGHLGDRQGKWVGQHTREKCNGPPPVAALHE